MKEANKTRLKRWIDIFALSIASSAVIYLASKSQWLLKIYVEWSELILALPKIPQVTLFFLGIYTIYKILKDFKVLNFRHAKNIHLQFLYPPIYFSIILVLFGIFIFSDVHFPNIIQLKIVAVIIIWTTTATALYFSNHPIPNTENSSEKSLNTSNDNFITHLKYKNLDHMIDLHLWILAEEHTIIGSFDDFERHIYVNRISKILLNQQNGPYHLAVVGEFGSGKSSISKSTFEKITKKTRTFIFVQIDGWGRSEISCGAQILEEVVDALSDYIDCSSIKDVPKHYLDALSGSGLHGFKSLSGLLQKYHNPLELLEKIDKLLEAIDKKLLIVLEDFDRKKDSENTINEIASLLDRLKKFKRINFIINIGYNINNDILSRICTRREDIVSIAVNKKLDLFFNLLNEYEIYKNPITIERDKSLIPQISNEIYPAIKTPRDFKQILRRVYTSWQELAGEINVNDLLILNIIRYTEPKAFEFVHINIDKFKSLSNDVEKASLHKGTLQYFGEQKSIENNFHYQGVNELILKLFPNAASTSKSNSITFLQKQKVAFLGETDYFKRALTEDAGDNKDSYSLSRMTTLSEEKPSNQELILEISKSTFLIEKFVQFYGFKNSENNKYLIHPKYVYYLLSILLSHKISPNNYRNYIERKDINFLINSFCKLNEYDGAKEILNKTCIQSLGAFSYLTNYFKIYYPTIDYDLLVLNALTTPEQLKISVIGSSYSVIEDTLSSIFIDSSQECIDKFMLLIIEMFKADYQMEHYINVIINTQHMQYFDDKLTKHKNELVKIKNILYAG